MLRMTPLPARRYALLRWPNSNCFLRWFVLVTMPLPRVYFPPTYAMHFAVGCMLVSGSAAATMPEASAKRSFDLPSGEAAAVFKQFIAQSRVQLLYVADDATSVRTNAVKGEFTPREAIDRILAGTSLIAVQTDSGSIAVKTLAPQVRPGISPTPIPPPAKPAEPAANPRNQTNAPQTPMKSPKLLSILSLLAFGAAEASAQTAPVAPATSETVELSPFMVTSEKDAGYYGANSMSGTRMNTKLEDIAASITVITKEQMIDLALLNMDDIFAYEAGTEGTATFTDFAFDRNQVAIDNTQFNPLTANRIRGIGPANVSFGNFETSGRTPIDVLDVDSVEIGRGPNSNVFGVGNASGTVNTVRASANPSRNRSQVSARYDNFDGYRTSLDLNRVLIPGKLAVRGSAVAQREGFQLKPSGVLTERFNAMARWQPFNTTAISGSYLDYHSYGNRPNTTTPRESITAWRDAGSPTWDPLTNSATVNGVTTVGVPPYFNRSLLTGNSSFMLDPGGLMWWGTTSGQGRNMQGMSFDPSGYRVAQPLVIDYPVLTSKAVYDWSRLNLGAPNRTDDKNKIASILVDQSLFTTSRQSAFIQLGWFRENCDRLTRNLIGNTTQSVLGVDVNKNLPDGRPNPGFLRPFLSLNHQVRANPVDRDTYRAQLAYKLDFTADKNRIRWLGRHDLGTFYEYKDYKSWTRVYEEVVVSDHAWLRNVTRAGPSSSGLPQGNSAGRPYKYYYLGDNQGQDVDYVPVGYSVPGTFPITTTLNPGGQWVTEPALLDRGFNVNSAASWTVLKTRGVTLQSRLLNDRVITTFGVRHDALYSRVGSRPELNRDGYTVNEASFLAWAPGDWTLSKGPTRTAGIVVKPLRWINLYANKSQSFQPATLATDIYLRPLPDPSGKGEDFGFMLKFMGDKIVVRANQYTTKQVKSRNGLVSIFASRLVGIDRWYGLGADFLSGPAFLLQDRATGWVQRAAAAKGETLTSAEINTRVASIMQVPPEFIDPFNVNMSSTSDEIAKGRELEINYNPTKFWTIKLNVTESETLQKNIGAELAQYLSERMKVWPTIIDPELGVPWFTQAYGSGPLVNTTAAARVEEQIRAPLALQLASEGLSNPQIRKYRLNAMTNVKFSGLTDQRFLKRMNVGGSLRWEDKGAIGYWGKQQLPAIITEYDPYRPIYDKDRLYIDAFAGYRTRLFRDKVGTTFQFNVRNLTEAGRLQPIKADPDGSISAWRIVSRRQFIFTSTFDF